MPAAVIQALVLLAGTLLTTTFGKRRGRGKRAS